jgi:hypothetical protein
MEVKMVRRRTRYVMMLLQSKPSSVEPIPVKKLGNQVVFVDGHTRALAAFLLGISEIPVARAKSKEGVIRKNDSLERARCVIPSFLSLEVCTRLR